jgi:HSP20 family molecular chaperone IbpA
MIKQLIMKKIIIGEENNMFYKNNLEITERNQLALADNKNILSLRPAVDIYETDDLLVLLAEMPGVDKEHIKVEVIDGKLHIFGKRISPKKSGEYLFKEIRDVQYDRFFLLEDNLDSDKISANYKKGMLIVEIGKKEKAKPRKIEIN